MKISKSKRQLAQLLIKAGVKQFPKGANWVAQDGGDATAYYYTEKPIREPGRDYYKKHHLHVSAWVELHKAIPNWHQTVLSRAEFDQVVAESAEQSNSDAGGWIEWKGGKCPVPTGVSVDVKYRDGREELNLPANQFSPHRSPDAAPRFWVNDNHKNDIVAYRLHKSEQTEPQYCESVTRAIPEPATAPTLDQLLQGYRNASDFAAAKQAEADEAAKMRDERWRAAQARACELGVHISVELVVDAEMSESEPVITDWRDLRVGDEIEVVESDQPRCNGLVGVVIRFDEADHQKPIRVIFDGNERDYDWPTKWRFIRRP
ncbi:MAG: hypothetical protein ACRCXB_26795 [Aeromonadaceae bacterium]